MYRHGLVVVLISVCLLLVGGARTHGPVAAQQSAQPILLMTGVQLADGTRYSVTLADPGQITLGDLQVSVQLPADALFDHALETPGFTQFAGNQDGTLTWNAVTYTPADVLDAFSFYLQQPSGGAFAVNASWDGDDAGQVQGQFQPAVQTATAASADITLDAATLAQGFVPVGNTGVAILGASGSIPDGTTIQVNILDADSNPGADQGDLWWCSVVDVEGLPAGASLLLLVPARQALPPNAPITLLTQDNASWNPLANTAQVTDDGQIIIYQHPGGIVAAGTSSPNQPHPASLASLVKGPVRLPVPPPTLTQGFNDIALVRLMESPRNCGSQNCMGLMPCGPGVYSPNLPLTAPGTNASAGTRSCASAAQGTTTCNLSGLNCVAITPLSAASQPFQSAGPGHGTVCSFPEFDSNFGGTCNAF